VPREVEMQRDTTGRTLRMTDVRESFRTERKARFVPSEQRSSEDRERRHRERAIAAWLRDLAR
jgi:hypothetical protein